MAKRPNLAMSACEPSILRIVREGGELYEKYCRNKERPLMFSPAPSQKRVDVFEGSVSNNPQKFES